MHNIRNEREFAKQVKEKRKHSMKPANFKNEEDEQLSWLLPLGSFGWKVCDMHCKMNVKDKNLWITGTKEQCEDFIKNAIGDDETVVYNKNKFHWTGYFGQPFIVIRLYSKAQRAKKFYTLKSLGDWTGCNIEKQKSLHSLSPNLYHCIILSTFTLQEYTKDIFGKDTGQNELGSLDWRYDTLNLRI